MFENIILSVENMTTVCMIFEHKDNVENKHNFNPKNPSPQTETDCFQTTDTSSDSVF